MGSMKVGRIQYGLCLVLALALVLGACASKQSRSGVEVGPRPRTTVSRVVDGGELRCTGSVPSSILPAHPLSVFLRLTNITSHPVALPEGETSWSLNVTAAEGPVYDSSFRSAFEPPPTPTPSSPLLPGHSIQTTSDQVAAQWGGPLRVVARCAGDRLPPLTVRVASPGPTPSTTSALRQSLRETGGLFRRCSPTSPAVAVLGTIEPPSGQAPASVATCAATVHVYDGFDVVTLSVITPPGADVGLPGANAYLPPTLPPREAAEGIVWRFVVSVRGAIDVGGSSRSRSWSGGVVPAKRALVPDFTWDGSVWSKGIGSCGSTAIAVGPRAGALIQFISACPRQQEAGT